MVRRKSKWFRTLFLALMLCVSTGVFAVAAAYSTAAENSDLRIGILSAMQSEVELLLSSAEIDHVDTIGGVDFHVGTLCDQPVVIAKAGIGKVLSAAGTAALLNNYQISDVIFTGVAGGVGNKTAVLDVVVGTDLVQHDYGQMTNQGFVWTASESGKDGHYSCDENLVRLACGAAENIVGGDHVFRGVIASGDQFVASEEYVKKLEEGFNAIACEMEGASVAAVCEQYGVPFVVIRTMSDKADGLAHESYENMVSLASDNSSRIVMKMLEGLPAREAAANQNVQYVLYLGTNDKDSNKPVFTQEEARKKARDILLKHFGGYTIQEAFGGWVDEGTVYQEYTLVIYLSDTTAKKVHAAADELIQEFHQSSVLIQTIPARAEFYSTDG